MKRLMLRLAALAGVVTVGLAVGIAAQRALRPAASRPADSEAQTALSQPLELRPAVTEAVADDAPTMPEWHVDRPALEPEPELAAVPDSQQMPSAPEPFAPVEARQISAAAAEQAEAYADAQDLPDEWIDPADGQASRATAGGAFPADAPTGQARYAPQQVAYQATPTEQPLELAAAGGYETDAAEEAPAYDEAPPFQEGPALEDSPGQETTQPEPFPPAAEAPGRGPAELPLEGPAFDPPADDSSYGPANEETRQPPVSRRAPASEVAEPTGASAAGELVGTGRPGDRHLEGMQSPVLTIEKKAPPEVQVGAPAVFQILVRNTGHVAAHEIEIVDEIPAGAELLGTSPQAALADDGTLVWQLGSLGPGEQSMVELQLVPLDEGELGSLAQVRFSAQASARTLATRPVLAVEISAPDRAMIRDAVRLTIQLLNTGSGAAHDVVVQTQLPEGLAHPAGGTLEYEVGSLAPGETRTLELEVTAAQAGTAEPLVLVRGAGDLAAEASRLVEVVAPALEVTMDGPKRRYLERQATYTVSVSNPGTAPARQVELITYLPPGLKFVEANNYGEYDPRTRAVRWLLEELPAQQQGEVTLVAMPVEPGEQKLLIEGRAEEGLSAQEEQTVVVEGLAAILFEVVDVEDPIEVGAETAYEIRVVNQGTKAASRLEVTALLPEGLELLDADGPTAHRLESGQVSFAPLDHLAPKSETVFHLRVRGRRAGDARLRVQLLTDEIQAPVTKEESTRIYADE